jgi:Amt family ammonium transporter
LATGLFASKLVNDAGGNGLFFGNPGQLVVQVIGILVTWVFAFVGSLILLKLVDAVVGLRINEEDEVAGLDISQHNESAYALSLVGSTGVGSSWGSSGHRPPPDH